MAVVNEKIKSIRIDYSSKSLDESEVNENPVEQFKIWMNEAINAEVNEPNAMSLATCGKDSFPSVRIVLLRKIDEGFSFFTNYRSQKGIEIEENPKAGLCFFWPELERQVRIEGVVDKVTQEESDEYFNSRPSGNRLGAWASHQSSPLKNRQELEELLKQYENQFTTDDIPRPQHWGGYRLTPSRIEFWQGRPSRLHDRIQYRKIDDKWKIVRLAP